MGQLIKILKEIEILGNIDPEIVVKL